MQEAWARLLKLGKYYSQKRRDRLFWCYDKLLEIDSYNLQGS